MGAVFLRKYNTTLSGGTLIRVPIVKRAVVDFAVGADWTPAAGDVKLSKDGGAAANIGTLPTAVAMGNGAYWEFTITGTELSCKSLVVTIADSATKAVEDQSFIVETFGDASAMYAADLSAANLPANVTQLLGTAWLTPAVAGTPDMNVKLISGDATAADNAEAFFDGTGYAGTGNVIPTVTTLTGHTPQTGDAYAIVSSGTHGNAALKTLIDTVDNFLDTEIASIISTLGTPAGVSLAADLVVIDDFVDALESRLTAARAGYLDNLNNSNLANVPAFPSNFATLGINASGHVSRVTLADTTTTNTDMITAAGVRAAVGLASANLDTQLDALPTNAELATALGTADDAVLAAIAALNNLSQANVRTALGMASANLDTQLAAIDDAVDTEIAAIQSTLASLFTTAVPQSYRTDGATGSVAQLLYEINAHLGEVAITSTTKRLNQIDGSTQAMLFTLNSASTPTAITRAS